MGHAGIGPLGAGIGGIKMGKIGKLHYGKIGGIHLLGAANPNEGAELGMAPVDNGLYSQHNAAYEQSNTANYGFDQQVLGSPYQGGRAEIMAAGPNDSPQQFGGENLVGMGAPMAAMYAHDGKIVGAPQQWANDMVNMYII